MSNGDQALDFIYLIGVLVLVGSALLVRRIPIAQSLKMAFAWLLIFAAAFAVFALKDDFKALGYRMLAEADGEVQNGRTLRIRQAEDGHFWVDGQINGTNTRFLIDSGATVTSLSAATARRAGVPIGTELQALVQTANGAIMVDRAHIRRLEVGGIVREDMPVHVSAAFGDVNVLGMDFLSSLSGWGVEGRWLVLKP